MYQKHLHVRVLDLFKLRNKLQYKIKFNMYIFGVSWIVFFNYPIGYSNI